MRSHCPCSSSCSRPARIRYSCLRTSNDSASSHLSRRLCVATARSRGSRRHRRRPRLSSCSLRRGPCGRHRQRRHNINHRRCR
ncbi:MAG: hypothetical protein BJ554DRAFT_2722 [Olpidium bornovanus]|uniref:Uncharacterized protein n=1 Tax=Olpidium bornovanus TaxID=278681 RepID=A0A8H7ZQ12_9FUNG|nr:MAG: hypothetical protein BJ554DRAFT_2722 [Olpidium bornovanus]